MPTPFVARVRYIIVNNDYGLGRKQTNINPPFLGSMATDKEVGGGVRMRCRPPKSLSTAFNGHTRVKIKTN